MKLKFKAATKINITKIPTLKFLDFWAEGETKALGYINMPVVERDLARTIQRDNYRLFRGIKLDDEEEVEQFFGCSLSELKRAKRLTITYDSPTSWTTDPGIARSFGCPLVDTINQTTYDQKDLRDYNFESGDLIKIGIIFYASVPRSQIFCDLNNIQDLINDKEEGEVIVKAGTFSILIESAQPWYYDDYAENEDEDGDEYPGYEEGEANEDCPHCDGDGFVEIDGDGAECGICHGEGKVTPLQLRVYHSIKKDLQSANREGDLEEKLSKIEWIPED